MNSLSHQLKRFAVLACLLACGGVVFAAPSVLDLVQPDYSTPGSALPEEITSVSSTTVEEMTQRSEQEPVPGDVTIKLSRVRVIGLLPPEQEEVEKRIPLFSGEELSRESLEKIRAFEESLVQNPPSNPLRHVMFRPMRDGVVLEAEEVEKNDWTEVELLVDFRVDPRITAIEIFPLVDVDARQFPPVIPVVTGDVYSAEQEAASLAALVEEARRAGVRKPVVTTNHRMVSPEEIVLGFIIEDSANPAVLQKLRFRDAGFGNAPKLRNFFKEPEPIGIDKGSQFRGETLMEMQAISADLMKSLGYLKAQARLDETDQGRKGIKVYYRIDRGEKFEIDEIVVESALFPEPAPWKKYIHRFEDRSMTSKRLEELEKAMLRRAYKEGYMGATVDVRYEYVDEDEVKLTAKMLEGEKSKMGSVQIKRQPGERGYGHSWYHREIAPAIRQKLIAKAVRAEAGEDLNQQVVRDTERRLWRLGVFDEVKVDTAATSGSLAVRDVVIDVKEARTARLGASVGWNDQQGAVVRLGFSERNIGGLGDILSFDSYYSVTNQTYGGTLSYFDRNFTPGEKWIGKHREPSMLYQVYHTQYGYREYIEQRSGGRVRMTYLTGKKYGPWSNSVSKRLEGVSYDPALKRDNYDEDFEEYLASTLGYNITYDTRDRGDQGSTEGVLFDTGVETGAANGPLLKWVNQAEYLQPINRRLGWQTNGLFGMLPYHSDDIGFGERFQLGGLETVRGFEYRGIGPVDNREEELRTGGSTATALQNELRIIPHDDVDIPLFVDAGTLEDSPAEVGTVRASTGAGLRVRMPESNQRAFIYYAVPLNREETDDTRILHFGFRFDL
ncbi:MAG: BamA/TamA family outer membrane protein [Candidatus Sumerlaeia bacterium]|nr:BamA/TamA family outer membrane protein [Candidatus Sumerlaeia bacterium]